MGAGFTRPAYHKGLWSQGLGTTRRGASAYVARSYGHATSSRASPGAAVLRPRSQRAPRASQEIQGCFGKEGKGKDGSHSLLLGWLSSV